jgi:D-xylose transport system permease protein
VSSELTSDSLPTESGLAQGEAPKLDVMLQFRKLWKGDSGLVPIIIGLIILVIYFESRSSNFLTAQNLTNLIVQATVFMLLGMAEIWLLLLGEIDLSVGVTCALSGMVATILTDPQYHWSWFIALPLAVLTSMAVSGLYAFFVIKVRLPSFIVTLAGFLAVQGVLIYVIDKQKTGGSVSVQETVLYDLVGGNLTVLATWLFIIICIAIMAIMMIRSNERRIRNNLVAQPRLLVLIKLVGLVLIGLGMVWVFNTNRSNFLVLEGMPFAIPIDLALLAGSTFILTKTRAGRYIYAIGGNSEAARRAGIAVNRYRLFAFLATGFTVGIAGLLYASRLGSISDNVDSTLTLLSVGSAVIGGTSLFGGRGKMIHAIIGGIIIATIYNGMALLQMAASTEYVVTAVVLIAAVTVDSLARRGSTVVK